MKPLGGDRGNVMAEINMVPFIDIVLVVLIIFMVMSPMLVRMQMKVNLPKAASSEAAPESKDTLEIGVEADGTVHLGDVVVAVGQLEAELRRVLVAPDVQPVYVLADKATPFEHVVAVMDAAKQAGAVKLGVGTRGPEAGDARRKK